MKLLKMLRGLSLPFLEHPKFCSQITEKSSITRYAHLYFKLITLFASFLRQWLTNGASRQQLSEAGPDILSPMDV